LALYNYNGLLAPRLSLYNFWFQFTRFFVFWVSSLQLFLHRASGKKAAVPIYKVLLRPGRESSPQPTSTEVDAFTTRPGAGCTSVFNITWHRTFAEQQQRNPHFALI